MNPSLSLGLPSYRLDGSCSRRPLSVLTSALWENYIINDYLHELLSLHRNLIGGFTAVEVYTQEILIYKTPCRMSKTKFLSSAPFSWTFRPCGALYADISFASMEIFFLAVKPPTRKEWGEILSPLVQWVECSSCPWHACQAAVPNQPREKPSARAALLNFNDSLCCGGAPLCPFIRRARKELIGQKMEGQGELTSH